METRIVQVALGNLVLASVYVPNGGKDYAREVAFVTALAAWAKQVHDDGRELILCGDINIARADIDVHPKERKADVIGQRPEERELFESLLGGNLVDVARVLDPDNPGSVHAGGRRGATCASATSDGASTTSSLPARSRSERRAAPVLADVGTSDHAPLMMTTT